jgi:hypothetical protein
MKSMKAVIKEDAVVVESKVLAMESIYAVISYANTPFLEITASTPTSPSPTPSTGKLLKPFRGSLDSILSVAIEETSIHVLNGRFDRRDRREHEQSHERYYKK